MCKQEIHLYNLVYKGRKLGSNSRLYTRPSFIFAFHDNCFLKISRVHGCIRNSDIRDSNGDDEKFHLHCIIVESILFIYLFIY